MAYQNTDVCLRRLGVVRRLLTQRENARPRFVVLFMLYWRPFHRRITSDAGNLLIVTDPLGFQPPGLLRRVVQFSAGDTRTFPRLLFIFHLFYYYFYICLILYFTSLIISSMFISSIFINCRFFIFLVTPFIQ